MLAISILISIVLVNVVISTFTDVHDKHLAKPHSIHELQQFQQKVHHRNLAVKDAEILPVYPGYGTHFVYMYVGTPPQRQSVIVDTGSHYTAFPCTGCSQCGQHTDSYWNPDNSSTAVIQVCNGQHCVFTQSYSEGSSWRAIKVVDKVWLGGLGLIDVPGSNSYSMDFQFGCQTSETGLFRTQLADGIMGLSMAEDTLPRQLVSNGITSTSTFALCFRVGGGIMTLGGVDQSIHLKPGVQYADMTASSGWYAVTLLDIQFANQKSGDRESLGGSSSNYNGGKGCIIDSGTTDSYFSSSLSSKFTSLFFKFTGVHYSSANIALAAEQLNQMPNIIFIMKGDGPDSKIEVEMPWSSYVDSVGGGKYAFRIYLSESSGSVLGANFMNGHNVIFDAERSKVGFAKSNCKYEDYAKVVTAVPTASPTKRSSDSQDPDHAIDVDDDDSTECIPGLIPVTECSAICNDDKNPSYIAVGNQSYVDRCDAKNGDPPHAVVSLYCHVPCNGLSLSRGHPSCTDTAWSDCSKKHCDQSKILYSFTASSSNAEPSTASSTTTSTTPSAEASPAPGRRMHNIRQRQFNRHSNPLRQHHNPLLDRVVGTNWQQHAPRRLTPSGGQEDGMCTNSTITRKCYSGACPVNDGDYLIFLDMKVKISPASWSYVHEENFFAAFSNLFKIGDSAMQLLNNPNIEESTFVKLHFELRLEAKNFNYNVILLHEAAQEISTAILKPGFKFELIGALENVTKTLDKIDYSRYGWMISSDVDIINAIAIPIGSVRSPFNEPVDPPITVLVQPDVSYSNGILSIVAVSAIVGLVVMIYMYCKLKGEHYALSKQNVVGGSLRQMWNKFANQARKVGRGSKHSRNSKGTYTGDRSYLDTDNIQMNKFRPDDDDQMDDSEYRTNNY